jgi:hypothetical protein
MEPGAFSITHGAADLSPAMAAMTVAVPLAIYLLATGVLHRDTLSRQLAARLGITSLLILAAAVAATCIGVPLAIPAMALFLTVLVAINVAAIRDEASNAAPGRAAPSTLKSGVDETTA